MFRDSFIFAPFTEVMSWRHKQTLKGNGIFPFQSTWFVNLEKAYECIPHRAFW